MINLCSAVGCITPIHPRHNFCGWHWDLLPPALQEEGFQFWRKPNERPREDHLRFMIWLQACIREVRNTEQATDEILGKD